MKKRRVVVTGMGQVSPVGNTVAQAWKNIIAGNSGIRTITRFDTSDLDCRIGGEVKNFNIEEYISVKEARRMDLFSTMAWPLPYKPLLMPNWMMPLI